jgi:diguanylate cyclase (GGDEF)-like protein
MRMKLRHITIGLALVVAVAGGVAVFRAELGAVGAAAENTLEVRANLLEQYIQLMRHNVYNLERSIEQSHARLERGGAIAPELDQIRHYAEHNVWGISGLAEEGGIPALSGTLTGRESLQSPSPPVRKELSAVLTLDHQFKTLLENVPDLVWVYYTSVHDFIYIAPDPAVADFRFNEDLRNAAFWAEAEPASNPERQQVITDLYKDHYGQGLMISISSPVEIDGAFTGIASLDLGIGLLRELTQIGHAAGDTILIDENNQIVARAGEFALDEHYAIPAGSGWIERPEAHWLSRSIGDDELRVLHRLPKTELYRVAAWDSALIWLALIAMLALVVFSVRLNVALSTVRALMHRDTLTGLLNRRGFAESVQAPRELARRTGSYTALLLLDIDHFKEVNDTWGHETGDEVLTALSNRLNAGLQEHDRLSRWGGEELLLCVLFDDPATLQPIGDRLRRDVDEAPLSKRGLAITVSGGLTVWQADEALEVAVDRADQLLYQAKNAGRNRIESDVHAHLTGLSA